MNPYRAGSVPLGRSADGVHRRGEISGPERRNETRSKPSRRYAWQRNSMVSQNEAGFALRENASPVPPCSMGQPTCGSSIATSRPQPTLSVSSRAKVHVNQPYLLHVRREAAREAVQGNGNRHLTYSAEYTNRNVGSSRKDGKGCSYPMPSVSDGASVVVRDRESLSHGEGRQQSETLRAKVPDTRHGETVP